MKKLLLSLCCIAWLSLTCSAQSISFTGHSLYQSPDSKVFAVASADLDMDGDQDILFTEPDQDLLHWFRNENNGVFTLQSAGVFNAVGVNVVDFDLDLDMDILACSYDSNQVALFINDGDQNFSKQLLSSTIQHPLMLAAADIDSDGDVDIVCATQDAGTGMVLMRNEGGMTFIEIQLSTEPYSSTWAMIVDLDLDQDDDILGNNFMSTGGLLWYEQTAPMLFTEHLIPFPSAHGGAAGDIDGDGDMDLAAASCGSSISWFENDGNNQFVPHLITGSFNCSVSVEINDINGDGKTDIIGESWSASKIAWWENDGNQFFSMHLICDTLVHPSGLAVADLTQDSMPDVVTGSYSKILDWFENKGTGTGMFQMEGNISVEIKKDPVSERILLRFLPSNAELTEVRLVDSLGRICYDGYTSESVMTIPVNRMKHGLYLISVQSASFTFSSKILID